MTNSLINGKVSLFSKVAILALVLSSILNIYGFPSWDIFTIYSLVFSFFYLIGVFLKKCSINIPRILTVYFIYWAILAFINTFSATSVLSPIQIWMGYVLFWGTFDYKTFYKYYRLVGVVTIIFFFIQFAAYNLTGIKISSFLPGLPIAVDGIREGIEIGKESYYTRFSSLFSEPAIFAQYLLPLLAIFLLFDNNKRHYLLAFIIVCVLFLLQSGNAFIGMAPIVAAFVISFINTGKRKMTRILLFSLLIIPVIYLLGRSYFQSEIGEVVLERTTEVTDMGDGGSAYLRLVRGIFVFNDYSVIEKIFGCPDNNILLSHIKHSGQFQGIHAELYFNGVQTLLLRTGIVGLFIFFVFFYYLWKGNNICGKSVLLSLSFLMCVASIFLSNTMLMYLLVSASMKTINQQKLTDNKKLSYGENSDKRR